ncbi:hypothetical protein Ct61P_14783 [Colletotrichum tofieldiae]|nr:hypothetical protein Ct61P_14783 [Colletotrichum tofieldiae]
MSGMDRSISSRDNSQPVGAKSDSGPDPARARWQGTPMLFKWPREDTFFGSEDLRGPRFWTGKPITTYMYTAELIGINRQMFPTYGP